ncbi:MAG: hypothetical protein K2F81_02395 [Ruminococcus sp.]|nr:hypothetical protein [Ruminococcus sp.]
MKSKVSVILKILGVLLVLGSVAYDLLYNNPQTTIYWIMLVIGIISILAGRIIERVTLNDYTDNE